MVTVYRSISLHTYIHRLVATILLSVIYEKSFTHLIFLDKLAGRNIWVVLTILGWGFPVPFVISALGVSQWSDYVGENTKECFPSTDGWHKWIFLGPIYLIIIVNIFVFISIMFILLRIHIKNRKHQRGSDLSALRGIVSTAMISTFLLGLPWIVSVFKILTHILNSEELPISIIDKVINWSFIILNSPIGLVWLIIVALRYKDCQAKKTKFVTPQEARAEPTNLPGRKINRRKKEPCGTIQDMEVGQVGHSPLNSSVHSNNHSDSTSQQTRTRLHMQTSNSLQFSPDKFDSIRSTKRVVPSSISLDNVKKIFTKPRPTSITMFCNDAQPVDVFYELNSPEQYEDKL